MEDALNTTDMGKYYEIPVTVYAEVNAAGSAYEIKNAKIDKNADEIVKLVTSNTKNTNIKDGPLTMTGGSSSQSSRGGKSRRNKKSKKGGKSRKAKKSLRRK
jgi:hypothetical protein